MNIHAFGCFPWSLKIFIKKKKTLVCCLQRCNRLSREEHGTQREEIANEKKKEKYRWWYK